MLRTTGISIAALALAFTLAACGGENNPEGRGTFNMPEKIGKGDTTFSCQNRCDQMAPGGCWCDDKCESYGDCCPDKKTACDSTGGGKEGEACGDDINVKCGEGLYCAFGLNWCGTPPVTGVCRKMGDCGADSDCDNNDNSWIHPMCMGKASCNAGKCAWNCEMPVAKEGDACGDDIGMKCGEGLYCAFGLNWCGTPPVTGVCRKMGDCGAVSDCNDPNNIWIHPMCMGQATCENQHCGWKCGI